MSIAVSEPSDDGERVPYIVLLATPHNQASQHLAVLAAFARLFSTDELHQRLLEANSSTEVCELLQSEDAAAINYLMESRPD